MERSKVAILRTSPKTVLGDYHELMNLAGYQDTVAKDADTGLKVNISWHFFYPASSTTPWQLEGVIRAMKRDGYSSDLIHACHNRTVVIDAKLGERENKQLNVVEAHGLRNVHLYENEPWINVRDAVGEPGLKEPQYLGPVLAAFAWALPVALQPARAPDGAAVALEITGPAGGQWTAQRAAGRWNLYSGVSPEAQARVSIPEDIAWRLFTRGLSREQAEPHVRLAGDRALGSLIFNMVSIIA